ncbi:MAG: choice-of-anchor L domain-containing protein [Saprospiraceae bacterium]|nr:choice-of-anchor L domain-containing protein [Saprospiraceae bacterium]
MNVFPGKTVIQLSNLRPGAVYQVIANGAYPEQSTDFRLQMALAKEETQAVAHSPAHRPQIRRFQSSGTHVELLLDIPPAAVAAEVPMYLSVAEVEPEPTKPWVQQFLQESGKLAITQGDDANFLVTNVLVGGNCFDVSNITSKGAGNSRGTFSSGESSINISNGVVLCTGPVSALPGPNSLNNANGGFSTNSSDDPNLATLTNGNQYDVSIIEFDFKPTSDMVQFDFVFGSEEYCEFVNSQYNDVFGFFISGPGITGVKNLAVLPNTTTPITVNNVNHNKNKSFYRNNNQYDPCDNIPVFNTTDIQLDGFTSVLTATANLQACATYHIKLASADIGDANYTSAVFLRANSFDAGGDVKASAVYPSAAAGYTVEGCSDGFIRFFRGSGDINQPLPVTYTIAGNSTATPGVDYAPFPASVVIPAGQTELLVPVSVIKDQIPEGAETIRVLLDNPCSCLQQDVTFVIQDQAPVAVSLANQLGCAGTVSLTPVVQSSGLPPLSYQWSSGQASASIQVNTAGTAVYTVTVTDACGLSSVASATATVDQTPTAILAGDVQFCPGSSDNLSIAFTGFGPWVVGMTADGVPQTQTFYTNPGLLPVSGSGSYALNSVVSLAGCPGLAGGTAEAEIVNISVNLNAQNPPCFGEPGSLKTTISGGNFAPYTYAWNTGANGSSLTNLPAGSYSVTVSTQQGCTAIASATLTEPDLLVAAVSKSNPITCYTPQSAVALTVSGGTPGYQYTWNSGATQADPVFTAGGAYSVTVKDAHNCTATTSVTIDQNTTPPVAATGSADEIDCNTTSVTLSSAGSDTGPQFQYLWSTTNGHLLGQADEPEPRVDAPGTYVLQITNTENGCTESAEVTVTENTERPTDIALQLIQPGCESKPGAIQIQSVLGGEGPYLYSLDDGFTFMGQSVFGSLSPGEYTLIVQDANGCEYAETVTLDTPVEPQVSLTPEVKLAFGETGTLTALVNVPLSSLDSIIWAPQGAFTPTGRPDEIDIRPFKSTQYSVTIISKTGCTDRAEVVVRVGDPEIYAPNAISPGNEDGQNDVFTLFTRDIAVNKIQHLQVYDRWGNQVYGRHDFLPNDDRGGGWDGKFRGKLMEPGVFTWWAQVELASGEELRLQGDVTIVK